jgi:polyphosphate kinase 2 (PPK2 family)
MMAINSDAFRVRSGEQCKLRDWPTTIKAVCESKKEYEKLLEKHVGELARLQNLHYASSRHALLLIFQGLDASGKDGAIRHVMSGVNPQGCEVFSFKQPSAEELQHDFLWRTDRRLPERGRIGIFNRSYYEEVLVVRLLIRSGTSITTTRARSKSFSICLTKNSASVSCRALMSRIRIGSSACRIFTSGNTGTNIWRLMSNA